MLALPHAVALAGLRAAIPIMIVYSLASIWTAHLMKVLFMEYKGRKVRHADRLRSRYIHTHARGSK